jgi:cell division protein FtsB
MWLQYDLWIGRNGIDQYQEVKAQVAQQTKINTKLVQRNQEMYAEINDLQGGLVAVQARARSELGFILPNETFFRIVSSNNAGQ